MPPQEWGALVLEQIWHGAGQFCEVFFTFYPWEVGFPQKTTTTTTTTEEYKRVLAADAARPLINNQTRNST